MSLLKEYYHYCEPDPKLNGHVWWKSANPEKMLLRLDRYIAYFEKRSQQSRVINCLRIKNEILKYGTSTEDQD
jgi:hypothetical protein